MNSETTTSPAKDIKKGLSVLKAYSALGVKKQDLLETEGIPSAHADVFLAVAKQLHCVIMTRTPGPACGMLLEQGYDAKSFWVKSKSCDWGPMAGFVCLDPLFNKGKEKGAVSNLEYAYKSLTEVYEYEYDGRDEKGELVVKEKKSSSAVQISINKARLDWLLKHLDKQSTLKKIGTAGDYLYTSGSTHILLKKEGELWRLYYDLHKLYDITKGTDISSVIYDKFIYKIDGPTPSAGAQSAMGSTDEEIKAKMKKKEERDSYIKKFWSHIAKYLLEATELKSMDKGAYAHYRPLMAMTNAHLNYSGDKAYLNAITGDYDLYAVWPTKEHQAKTPRMDERVAGMTANLSNEDLMAREGANPIGKVVGNISERIYEVAQEINWRISAIEDANKVKLADKVNRVFHSDEGGRPFMEEVDSAIGFSNDGKTIFQIKGGQVDTKNNSLSTVIEYFGSTHVCYINKGWDAFLTDAAKKLAKWSAGL